MPEMKTRRYLLWLIPALICFLYGFLILGTGSGTLFFLIWFFLGGCFILLLFTAKNRAWQILPKRLRITAAVLLAFAVFLFLFVEIQIIRCYKLAESRNDADSVQPRCIIVLGAQVYENGPSVVLRYRLDAACDYLARNPEAVCIVSGGQGFNEPFEEAYGMKDYLLAQGIDPSRIYIESRSLNTKENMLYSREMIESGTVPGIVKEDSIGIVTNNFHLYRALSLARKQGFTDLCGISAGSSPLYLPNNLLREFLGVVKDYLAGNLYTGNL